MIFNCLDFHVRVKGRDEESQKLSRAFRVRINHIVDSFSMRIPPKIRTKTFHKLNVVAYAQSEHGERFWAMEGIGNVELIVPEIALIYLASQAKAIDKVKDLLLKGIRIAAKHDQAFALHMDTWDHLLSTVHEEFDFDLRITRSHRSRRWRCDAVIRIGPTEYGYDVVVRESKTMRIVQRHCIKATECLFPFFTGIGFSSLRWDADDIVVLREDSSEVVRFNTGLSC